MTRADRLCMALGAALILAGLAGCAQPWTFAQPTRSPTALLEPEIAQPPARPPAQTPAQARAQAAQAAASPPTAELLPAVPTDQAAARRADTCASPLAGSVFEPAGPAPFGPVNQPAQIRPVAWISDGPAIVRLPPVTDLSAQVIPAEAVEPVLEIGPAPAAIAPGTPPAGTEFGPLLDAGAVADVAPTGARAGSASWTLGGRLCALWWETLAGVRHDHRNYYSWVTLRELGLAVGLAAPLANTSLDEDFQSWYQRDVRSSGTDDFARFWKTFGEGQIFVPAFAGLAFAGGMLEGVPLCGHVGDYAGRVTRGYLVGAPPMLFMQVLLGASRPDETVFGSRWKPFDDSNAVSGHAFMGAVPFIMAAQMTERPLLKAGFYLASTFPACSRVNDNAHYLSQIALGWWMAWLACRAVNEPDLRARSVWFQPWGEPGTAGIALLWRR